ncbi:MAG: class D sortase [Oscillospiraceae bacterium]
MKKLKFPGPKEKTVIVLFVIMTLIAAAMTVIGALRVYRSERAISEGLCATELSMSMREIQPHDASESRKEVLQEDAHDDEEATGYSGYAILTVHTPKAHRFAVYDELTSEHLWMGVAHISETAQPGESGNCVIFGHRDTVFKWLKDIQVGNRVTLKSGGYEYVYLVEKTQVCLPEAPEMTQRFETPYLTLVTCHPFVYGGPAPERFLVICRLDTVNECN